MSNPTTHGSEEVLDFVEALGFMFSCFCVTAVANLWGY
jgi:hypothetical protein